MPTTRGGLVPGKIVNVTKPSQPSADFMFNPTDYTINKTNSYSPGSGGTGQTTPNVTFTQGQPRTLALSLWFDTFSDGPSAAPVTDHTAPLWAMMDVKNGDGAPPIVEFQWGSVHFKAVITSLSEKFMLFQPDGTPVRAMVTVNLQEKPDDAAASSSAAGASAGSSASPASTTTAVTTSSDQPLHVIAANVTGDPANYRAIASANNIDNPLKVKNGMSLNVNITT